MEFGSPVSWDVMLMLEWIYALLYSYTYTLHLTLTGDEIRNLASSYCTFIAKGFSVDLLARAETSPQQPTACTQLLLL